MKMNFLKKLRPTTIRTRHQSNQMKMKVINNFFDHAADAILNIFLSPYEPTNRKNYTELKNGKIVEKKTISRDEEEDAQNRIFADIMSKMNGDREIVYDVPEEIEIDAFENDDMDPNERDLIQDTIDAINETNDIRREGKFRTKETYEKELKEHNEKIVDQQKQDKSNTMRDMISRYCSPILGLFVNFGFSVAMIIVVDRLSKIMGSI